MVVPCFEFATATRIIFGPGVLGQAGIIAKEFGQRALVVTGQNQSRAEPLIDLLRSHGISSARFSVSGEPEIKTVEQGVTLARKEKCDLVISVGGGIALDIGKAITAMPHN